jgi:N-ethylmaleimide reductase
MNLFNQYKLGNIELNNRLIMAPMTRSRAIDNIPNDLMVEYYRLRAAAGLIITEGVAPSANGLGYPRIPGIYNQAQIEGWKKVTDAVHAEGGKIFIQLMHTGRVSHPENMEANTRVVAPSAVGMSGEMWTDANGLQAYPEPLEMTLLDIEQAQEEFVEASKNAIEAGFDGVELHGANGYLIDQFINTASNKRQDEYGGSVENRSRFVVEVASKVANAIGAQRTGIRLSPYGVYNDMEIFEDVDETFGYLAGELGKLNLLYIHIVDFSSQGAPEVPESVKSSIRTNFGRDIIASGGLDREKAENILSENKGSLVAFGQAFLANPDLVYRLENNLTLNSPDYETFFTPGEKGYLDYSMAINIAE